MRRIFLFLLLSRVVWGEPVKVTFVADPPVREVKLDGKSYTPEGDGTFLLPLYHESNFEKRTATLLSDAGISTDVELEQGQNLSAQVEVHYRGRNYWIYRNPWIYPAVLAPLALGFWLWRRTRTVKTDATNLQQQQDAVLEVDPNYPLVGQTLGVYRLEAPLGQGGMATVYRGRSPEGTAVAVKVISTETETVEFRTRFEREIKVSHTLKHPNVVEVLNWGQDEHRVYLVLELVDGQGLGDLLPPEGFPVEKALEFSEAICSALEYAHERGVVHRDLKPDNVMVTRQGVVKLMDFGLARDHEVQTVTMTGQALGTPNYMPPEQVLEKSTKATLNPRSDQYSLAVTVYELLCGALPFTGDNAIAVIGKHLYDQPESLLQRKPGLPAGLEAVIFRALAKDPQERYASVADFRQALRAAVS